MSNESTIAITSLVIAILSALFTWFTFRAAEKTNNIEILGNLYETYRSDELLRDLKLVWNIYHRLWNDAQPSTESEENGDNKSDDYTSQNNPDNADKGILLPEHITMNFYQALDINSDEYKAIHGMLNFWTYVQLLLRRKIISPKEILAFTSPRILGFLFPMQKAHDVRYKQEFNKYASLEYSYRKLKVAQQ